MRSRHGSCGVRLALAWLLHCVLLGSVDASLAHAETAVIRMDGAHQRVNEATREAVEDALQRAGTEVVDAPVLAARYRDAVPAPRYDDAAHAFVSDAGQRAHAVDRFFTNDFPPAIAGLAPWLDVLESDPSVLARNPELATTAFHSMLTLARAYTATGADARAADALARTMRLFWFASLDPLRHPPQLRQAVADARTMTPVREVRVLLDAPECTLRVNGIAVEAPGQLTVPLGSVYVQAACAHGDSAVHRLLPSHTERMLRPRLDAMTRADDTQVWLEPEQLGDHGLLDELEALRVLLALDTLVAVRWESSNANPSERALVLVHLHEGESPRTVRLEQGVYPTLERGVLEDAIARLQGRGDEARGVAARASETEGVAVDARMRTRTEARDGREESAAYRWTAASASFALATATAGATALVLRQRAIDDTAACRAAEASCVLAGDIDARRAAVDAWHRRSAVLWGTAAGLATGSVIALVLETKRKRRNATLGVAASLQGARATFRVRF